MISFSETLNWNLSEFSCKSDTFFYSEAGKCPTTTQPHATECNKYLKCVQLPSDIVSWITLQCQEGLIYDKNLRSCAIPTDDWECFTEKNNEDDQNVYDVDDLNSSTKQDEFLEVIDENLTTSDDEQSSGDGEVPETFTPSSATSRMITTQLQRLTQLMKHASDQENGVVDDEVSADDLNSFLAVQNIQSEYQKIDFSSEGKTAMPSSGRIHPAILSDILDQQSQLNSEANRLTTLSMDATTKPPRFKKDPITEIQLKGGLNSDGTGSHQIVVNRPEGSVLFNVPAPVDSKHQPYLSEDILKTILEISKSMVTQNHQKQPSQHSYPFYYPVPIMIQPQSSVGSYFDSYRSNLTDVPVKKPQTNKVEVVPTNYHPKIEKVDASYAGVYPNQQAAYSGYQNPSFYYQNYPQYNGYPNYQQYSPFNSFQYPQNQFGNKFDYSHGNFDGAYYGNRPFVIESSAPSYVDQQVQQKPFRKESYATYGEEEDESGALQYDEVESENEENPQEELICSYVVQRQANKTDCFKYYVCNAKTKQVLTYTCPVFTAFNDQTKFCDAMSYKACKKAKDRERSSLENQQIYDEAHATLAKVKKESQKVERIASMVRKESQKIYNRRTSYPSSYQDEPVPVQYQSFQQPLRVQKPLVFRQQPKTTPSRPKTTKKLVKKKKKIRVKCSGPGNIVDPESETSYWHCFKGKDGRMKRINRKCAQSFIFCPTTNFCTSPSRC